jgi:hypothetical protein
MSLKDRVFDIMNSLEIRSRWLNIESVDSRELIFKSQLERLHKNVNNIVLHLLNLDPFLTKIRGLMKEIMLTIADDWDIKSPVPQTTLTRKNEKRKSLTKAQWGKKSSSRGKFKKVAAVDENESQARGWQNKFYFKIQTIFIEDTQRFYFKKKLTNLSLYYQVSHIFSLKFSCSLLDLLENLESSA